jgi:hypothetical protein
MMGHFFSFFCFVLFPNRHQTFASRIMINLNPNTSIIRAHHVQYLTPFILVQLNNKQKFGSR